MEASGGAAPHDEELSGAGGGEERLILCRACGHPVTDERFRIECGGSHEHTFFNPSGIVFQIGCFARAPGMIRQGEPVAEFSWFPGFRWSHVLCAWCGRHLGWHYGGDGGEVFFGLILGCLTREGR